MLVDHINMKGACRFYRDPLRNVDLYVQKQSYD